MANSQVIKSNKTHRVPSSKNSSFSMENDSELSWNGAIWTRVKTGQTGRYGSNSAGAGQSRAWKIAATKLSRSSLAISPIRRISRSSQRSGTMGGGKRVRSYDVTIYIARLTTLISLINPTFFSYIVDVGLNHSQLKSNNMLLKTCELVSKFSDDEP